MTTTSTDPLAALMSARKAEITGQPVVPTMDDAIVTHTEYIDVNLVTGEIVPAAAAEGSPTIDQGTPPGLPAAAPAPVEVRYPEIPPKVVGGLPYIRDYVKLARTIDQTEMVPAAFRGRYDAITAAFMRGYEMGLGPMQALDSFNVIQGKVGLTAEAMRALILNAGHDIILEEYYDAEDNVVGVKAECHRKQWPEDRWASYSYNLNDAKKAGLLGKNSWKENTRAMLDARATSGAGRRYFADVLAGMSYTPEEIRDFSGPAEQEVPSSPSAPTPTPAAAVVSESAEVPSATPTAVSAESGAQPIEPTSTPPSAKPRGRPRKSASTQTPPSPVQDAEPPPPLSEDSTTAPAPLPDHGDPGNGKVTASMLTAYREIIAALPTASQPVCRAFIAQHFPGRTLDKLTEGEIQKCIDIAVGWPDSAEQHPIDEDGQGALI